MYGKIFSSLFTGSMYGAGAPTFAVMSYVIANMKPDKTVGFQVELNVKDLAHRIGESEPTIQSAIDYLCTPDPDSNTPDKQGKRLIKIGSFDYQVVNGVKYDKIKNEEQRREANRIRQQKHRDREAERYQKGYDKAVSKHSKVTPYRQGKIAGGTAVVNEALPINQECPAIAPECPTGDLDTDNQPDPHP